MPVSHVSSAARLRPLPSGSRHLARYGMAVVAVALALAVRWLLRPWLGDEAPFLVFVLAVLWASWYGGSGPGWAATGLSALAAVYFFLPPIWNSGVRSESSILQGLIFFSIGGMVSALNARLRRSYQREGSGREALAASEEHFRLLIEGVRDYAMFLLDTEGRVVLWNEGAQRIKGFKPEEILNRHLSLVYPPEQAGLAEQHLAEAAATGTMETEGWRVRHDGSRFWASVTITALRDDEGRLRGFAKVTRDVTERKKAEDEIHSLNETLEERVEQRTAQLDEANRALQAFGYSVSHDLRAPLRAIQGFAQALLEDNSEELDETGRDYTARIVAASNRMERLIQDLLAYSRLNQGDTDLRVVDLEGVIDEAASGLLDSLRARGGQIAVERPLPAVLAHAPTLTQVVTNLLGNAATFVGPGKAPRIRVRAEEANGRLRLWVEDQGIGIAPEHQDRIFDVFERLHGVEEYPGTGVGLAIVRKGVERMGGKAGVESRLGEGARFWIELQRPRSGP